MFFELNLILLAASGGQESNPTIHIFFILSIFAVMYFFMIRPQSQQRKKQENFIANLKKGDRIVTIGGIYGKVLKVNENNILVEVDNNTKLKIVKSVVSIEFSKLVNSDAESAATSTEKASNEPADASTSAK